MIGTILGNSREVLDCCPESPHGEDVGNWVAPLVCWAQNWVGWTRGTFRITEEGECNKLKHPVLSSRNCSVALHTVEKDVKASADVYLRWTTFGVCSVNYTQDWLKGTVRNTGLERARSDIENGSTSCLGAGSSSSRD